MSGSACSTRTSGLYLVTKRVVEAMPEGGSIVIIGSGVALRGMPGRVHYASSKAGAVGMTSSVQGARAEGDPYQPDRSGDHRDRPNLGLTPEGRTRYERLTALQRLGESEDIADTVLFLASDLSRYVTGQTIYVDGGI